MFRVFLRSHLILLAFALVPLCGGAVAIAQEPMPPPAYLSAVEGTATIERAGDLLPAVRDMPFVAGDRLRTEAGRVEIEFPDGTAIEVGSYSEVEAISDTRVRLIAGTMDHLPRRPVRATSNNYLPADLQRYGPTFDQYGSWNYDASYGYVWYPQVTAEWRPYYYGAWASVPSYGWTWVGLDPWSWPTHHYGRWGYARNAWFWIPGRAWASAWVSWGIAANYVSWCPLGFDGRAVFALTPGIAGRPWHGWTVVARDQFGYRGRYAHRDAIDPRRFDAHTPFVQTARLPVGFGRDRNSVRSRTADIDRVYARKSPQAIGSPPSAQAGTAVAVPRGTITGVPRRTGNNRPVTPVVPPVASPVIPPVAKPVTSQGSSPGVPPVAPSVPAPAYEANAADGRTPSPDPRARPAVPRDSAGSIPRSPTPERPAQGGASPLPSPQATPRGSAAPAGKTESAPAKRPR